MSRKFERFGIGFLLFLMTLGGFFAWFAVMASQGVQWASVATLGMGVTILPFLLYAFTYLLVLPLGTLNAFVEKQTAVPQSPFAQDRLPDQQILPGEDTGRAY